MSSLLCYILSYARISYENEEQEQAILREPRRRWLGASSLRQWGGATYVYPPLVPRSHPAAPPPTAPLAGIQRRGTQALWRHKNTWLETRDASQALEVWAMYYRWVRPQEADNQLARLSYRHTSLLWSSGQEVSDLDLGVLAILSDCRATQVNGHGEPLNPRNATRSSLIRWTSFQVL